MNWVRYIEAHGFAHRSADGSRMRVIGVDRDVTHLRESERALISLAQRLQFALGSAGYGIWEADCRTGHIEFDDELLDINGLRREDTAAGGDYHQRTLHPEDAKAAKKAFAW